MPFAVTHVLSSIIAVDLYRDYFTKHKRYFTLTTILTAGIAGLLPDIDIPINFLLNLLGIPLTLTHRGMTHTLLFAILFLLPGLYFWKNKKHKIGMLFFVTTFGILLHILLDVLFSADYGIMLLWPFLEVNFSLNLLNSETLLNFYAAIDALLLIGWLVHEEIKHKIKDFI